MSAVVDVEKFKSRTAGRRITEETADEYAIWIRRFEQWRQAEGYIETPDLGQMIDFDSYLHDESMSDYLWENSRGRPAPRSYSYSARSKAASAIKLWLRIEYNVTVTEEPKGIVAGEPEPFKPKYISERDVDRIVADATKCKVDGCQAALQLSYDAILRASELVQVERSDIDLDQGTIYVHATKGSNDATVGLSNATIRFLEQHLNQSFGRSKVFINSYGNPWRKNSWAKHFIEHHHEVGSHAFGRHSPIVHRLERGEPFGDVFRRARHSFPSTTARYARHVGADIPDWASD